MCTWTSPDKVYFRFRLPQRLTDVLKRSRLQRQSIYSSTLQAITYWKSVPHKLIGTMRWPKACCPILVSMIYKARAMAVTSFRKCPWNGSITRPGPGSGYLNLIFTPHIGKTNTELSVGGMAGINRGTTIFNHYSLTRYFQTGNQRYTQLNPPITALNPAAAGQAHTSANPNTYYLLMEV